MKKLPIGLQLYSLRDLAGEDFRKTLELAAELGYEGVEFAGYFGLSDSQLKDILQSLGLIAVSSHVSYNRLTENLQEEIEYNLVLGNNTLVCPIPPEGFKGSVENWKNFALSLTEVGKKLNDRGLRLAYHNHSFEFEKYDGIYGLDIFYETADPRYVLAQIDLGWTMHGGEDPLSYLRKFAGRCPLVHVKDFDQNNQQTDVGDGLLDLAGVFLTAHEVGVEWLILETEVYAISPLASVKNGLQNLRNVQKK